MTYKIIIDNGKPREEQAESEDELRAVLKQGYDESQNGDYAYFDVFVYNEDGTDITESQYITEIVGEIIEQANELNEVEPND